MMTTQAITVATNLDIPVSVKAGAKSRMVYLDKLKVGLTILVIAHHAAQAYGPTGGQWPIFSPERSALLGPFFTVNASFFMGLFFLISGYFVPRAFDRKGTITFLKDRFQRLGIPLLFFCLLLTGPMLYFSQDEPGSFRQFINYVYPNEVPTLFAHMWFVAHLLVYAIGYALWRWLTQHSSFTGRLKLSVPTHLTILIYVLVLTIVTAVVRIWYPIDRWETLLVFPAEIAHLPQYVSLFVIGMMAYRGDWLQRLPTATGMIWLWIGLTAAGGRYAYSLLGSREWLPLILTTSGLFWSLWEALICVGLCVGLLVLFRERDNGQSGKLLLLMAGAAYTAYIIHLLVVIGIQFGLDAVTLTPFAKFVLVALLGTILSFGIGHLVRQLPNAKKIL
jgi:fucose 4-O-acetylase-like acetyltransferase